MQVLYISLIPIFLAVILIMLQNKKHGKWATVRRIIKNKRKTEDNSMIELAKSFVGKECVIYTLDAQIVGMVKEVSDGGAVLVKHEDSMEIVNADYIVRLREYPRNKKGKKKAFVV